MGGRGTLRVLLGAAPGVGKTYDMLAEGHRLLEAGKDVAVAIVETHDRSATTRMVQGLPIVPRRSFDHLGVVLEEMDLDAVLARAPDIALVDELAHTNAPGSRHLKRWRDVDVLLDAGIDVISTVNIQHIDSLNDVVEQITGVPQCETVPDRFLRSAAHIEIVDLAPQALRDRLAGGDVYPAERVDAALSNFFRLGNLTALRELALLWLADEVDQALRDYRTEQGIASTWEARERVVVALTGGPEGVTLMRRGARIAARSGGGEIIAVHITSHDGLPGGDTAALAEQRSLVQELGGTFAQVVGEDIPSALVEYARSVNATQLVLGASRRRRLTTAITGPGIGATVIRESGDIDVHIVNHSAASGSRALPRLGGALSLRRRLLGAFTALLGGPALTWLLIGTRDDQSITTDVLAYQLLVVVVALIGGLWPALFAAVLSGITLDYYFIEPLQTITIDDPSHALSLVLYVTIALLVSVVVDRAARHTRAAQRAAAESALIQSIAGSVLQGHNAVQALVDRAQEAFRLRAVVVRSQERTVATAGSPGEGPATASLDLGGGATVELFGPDLRASDRRLLSVVTAQLASVLEHERLEATAEQIEPIAASDRVRGALLSALSHDLRRPLAAASAAVGGLRASGPGLSPTDRQELLETAEESLGSLSTLLTDLLDVSRLQAEMLSITTRPTDPADAIAPALDELQLGPLEVSLALHHDAALAAADPVLLQRVIVNLLANARRFSPPHVPVQVTTSTFARRLEVRIIDHGVGVDEDRKDAIFTPFQRLGDTDNTTGLGLGLALSKGFTESMNGTLTPEDTPGGGLTMVISLELADEPTTLKGAAA